MTQQLLDGPDGLTGLQEVGGEGVPQRMAGGGLDQASLPGGPLDGPLHHGLVQVVASAPAGDGITVVSCGREHPLPAPLPAGGGILARQADRQGRLPP